MVGKGEGTHMASEALEVIRIAQRTHKLPGQVSLALPANSLLPTGSSAASSWSLRYRLSGRLALSRRWWLHVHIICIRTVCHGRLSILMRRRLMLLVLVECAVVRARRPVLRWETRHRRSGPPAGRPVSLSHVQSLQPHLVVVVVGYGRRKEAELSRAGGNVRLC